MSWDAGRGVLLALALLVAPLSSARAAGPAPAEPGRVVQRTFANDAGARDYFLYVPTAGAAGRPLMVWLHGCGATGAPQAGHALARVAEERGFVLVAPVQDRKANPQACWNWFSEGDRHRGRGEASILADLTRALRAELGTDPARVYVGGYSAGGAMTSVMGAAYPDLYAALGPSSGAPYGDAAGLLAYAEMGPRARPQPAFILQGVLDEISNYGIGRANIAQWLGTDDLADDGQANFSVPRWPERVDALPPADGQPVPLAVEHYRAADGCDVGRFLTSPAEHLVDAGLFSTDAGLGVQRLMMDFLLAHRLGAPHHGCG